MEEFFWLFGICQKPSRGWEGPVKVTSEPAFTFGGAWEARIRSAALGQPLFSNLKNEEIGLYQWPPDFWLSRSNHYTLFLSVSLSLSFFFFLVAVIELPASFTWRRLKTLPFTGVEWRSLSRCFHALRIHLKPLPPVSATLSPHHCCHPQTFPTPSSQFLDSPLEHPLISSTSASHLQAHIWGRVSTESCAAEQPPYS